MRPRHNFPKQSGLVPRVDESSFLEMRLTFTVPGSATVDTFISGTIDFYGNEMTTYIGNVQQMIRLCSINAYKKQLLCDMLVIINGIVHQANRIDPFSDKFLIRPNDHITFQIKLNEQNTGTEQVVMTFGALFMIDQWYFGERQ